MSEIERSLHPEQFLNTLLIIGNGFDLHLDIKTDYKTFFDDQMKNPGFSKTYDFFHNFYMEINLNGKHLFRDSMKDYGDLFLSEITVWDLLFMGKSKDSKNKNWCDIEEEMANSLVPISKITPQKVPGPPTLWKKVKTLLQQDEQYEDKMMQYQNPSLENFIAAVISYCYPKIGGGWKNDRIRKELVKTDVSWAEFLLNQLKLFEKKFGNFVIEQIKNRDLFNTMALGFAHHILEEDIALQEYPDIGQEFNFNILSFNYTWNYDDVLTPGSRIVEMDNVHGIAKDGGIIFGIDNVLASSDDYWFPFTKTYRKLEKYTNSDDPNPHHVFDPKITRILFYGHSLNRQDYSYFQSIFDFYEIYSKPVTLVFFYSIYEGVPEEVIKKNVTDRVYALLNNYGKTFDNQAKGKNLSHMLLLGPRVFIKKI